MSIEKTEQVVMHLQRTSETDDVAARWGLNEVTRALNQVPEEFRAGVVWHGWRGMRLSYETPRSELEIERDRSALLLAELQRLLTPAQLQALKTRTGL